MVPPGQEATGPPCRPVCGASRSPNGPLSHILSEVLNAMADQLDQQVKTECRSTEELVAGVEVANGRIMTRPTVFSMDVKALYPSLKAKVVAKEVSKVFLELDLKVEVDDHQLGLYLVLVVGREELVRQGLGHITPTRRHTTGTAPSITTAEVSGGTACESKFIRVKRTPTTLQRRKMVALALEQGILATMQSHSYRFHGKTYLQSYRSHYLISGNFSGTFSDTAKNSGIF